MLTCSGKCTNSKPYYLPLLLIISLVTHFPFVLSGFGEIDATKIAVSVIDMIHHGSDAAFANFYFTDVIPLYILYLKWCMKLLNNNYSALPIVMNYTNALFGTLTVIPAYLFIRGLFDNSAIAFWAVLALIFAPSFYQSTVMGFPHLIAFFFLLLSLCFYLSGLDSQHNRNVYLSLILACLFLSVAFLFKSDYVLTVGVYIGLLFMRKVKDKGKITSAFLIILLSGILFLLCRNLILGPSSGTTMSKEGLSDWYEYSLIIPTNFHYLIRQVKPIAYGAGIATFCLGLLIFLYYLLKKNSSILSFILSWTAVPTLFWLVMIGNNARHNMATILPLIVIIIFFFHEKAPKYVPAFTMILILLNFYAVSPSYSILTPSGNLIKSNTMLKDRMEMFRSRAKEITALEAENVAVLGYFHNPHVVYELLRSVSDYEAVRIGREDYKITFNGREYVFVYFVVLTNIDMEEGIDYVLDKYHLQNHLFVSATYDLAPFVNRGLKTESLPIIERSSL